PTLHNEIFAFDIAECLHCAVEWAVKSRRRFGDEVSNAPHPACRLGVGANHRPGERCRHARDERAPIHYSITRSARRTIDNGLVRPSALAVLRLMTSLELRRLLDREVRGLGTFEDHPSSSYKGSRTLAWLKLKVPNYREGERGWTIKADTPVNNIYY